MSRNLAPGRDSDIDTVQPSFHKRDFAYAIILGILAAIVCFTRLSQGSLSSDEAAFACTTDRMRTTGDWVVPQIVDEPHLNATPLYNWLTLALSSWLDESPLRYRFWSATFGVGCVLMTFVLGSLFFRSEVGFLAGLFLTFNRDLLFYHGYRFGGMESMLTLFITSGICCYVLGRQRPERAWLGWSLLGLCMGLAWLSKPPIFASFFLALILFHHFWSRRHESMTRSTIGPAMTLGIGLLVAAPWYVMLWSRLGNTSLYTLFVYNSIDRALDPIIRDFAGCHRGIHRAATSFKIVDVTAICGLVCYWLGHRRSSWGLLLLLTGAYVLALSATGKAGSHLWYTFYAFPLFAVMLAGFFLDAGPRLVVTIGVSWRTAWKLGMCLAAIFVGVDAIKVARSMSTPSWVYPPMALYERCAIVAGGAPCRFVLFDFPHSSGVSATGRSGANYEDLYYCTRMWSAQRVDRIDDLKQLLSDQIPTVVVLPSLQWPTAQSVESLCPERVIRSNPIHSYTYPVLMFHGAASKIEFAELVRLARSNQP